MTKSVIVIGAGGHARVVVALARSLGYDVVGCTDGNPALIGTNVLGVPVMGPDEMIFQRPPAATALALGIGSNGPPRLRCKIYDAFTAKGYDFPTMIHPAALVDDHAVLGRGTQVMAGAIIQPNAIIGDNVVVNTRSVVEHDCVVGDHVHLATACVLAGGARIGRLCHVGAGAVLRNGIVMGDCAVAGLGAAVIADVPAGITVIGVPARPISAAKNKPLSAAESGL